MNKKSWVIMCGAVFMVVISSLSGCVTPNSGVLVGETIGRALGGNARDQAIFGAIGGLYGANQQEQRYYDKLNQQQQQFDAALAGQKDAQEKQIDAERKAHDDKMKLEYARLNEQKRQFDTQMKVADLGAWEGSLRILEYGDNKGMSILGIGIKSLEDGALRDAGLRVGDTIFAFEDSQDNIRGCVCDNCPEERVVQLAKSCLEDKITRMKEWNEFNLWVLRPTNNSFKKLQIHITR